MRLAVLHLTNAISKEAVADRLHHVRKPPHLNDRDYELLEVVRLCKASMRRPRKYKRKVVRAVPVRRGFDR